ncbi:MAG: hypothetical protein KA885_03795 [Spirochaetes bacterium]|nr:hypothetical protein [Spirochaetota bacterium]
MSSVVLDTYVSSVVEVASPTVVEGSSFTAVSQDIKAPIVNNPIKNSIPN